MHSRRALLYMPGIDRHKIEKALTLGVDCICMDMEDGVAFNRKKDARSSIGKALQELDFGNTEKLARINAVGTGLEADDLASVLPCHPDGVLLPKVESLDQLNWAAGVIEAAELAHGWAVNSIRVLADVETARGILNLKEITSHPRLEALLFGAEDLAASLGATRTPQALEVFTARSMLVLHAKACGLQAIDMANVDFQDLDSLRQEARFGVQMGYTGKQIIHPAQVGPVQEEFTPTQEMIASAMRLVEAFDTHQKKGLGAFALDGRMIDMPLVKAAQNVIERARAAGRV